MRNPSRRTLLRQAAATGMAAVFTPAALRCSELPAAEATAAVRWAPGEPPNRPIGQAQGIFPGRVVWIHDPEVARWDGDPASGGWFEDKFTDPALADQMLRHGLADVGRWEDRCGDRGRRCSGTPTGNAGRGDVGLPGRARRWPSSST